MAFIDRVTDPHLVEVSDDDEDQTIPPPVVR